MLMHYRIRVDGVGVIYWIGTFSKVDASKSLLLKFEILILNTSFFMELQLMFLL